MISTQSGVKVIGVCKTSVWPKQSTNNCIKKLQTQTVTQPKIKLYEYIIDS